MNYGLYISASGTLNALYRMDVAANNLANSETAGFKPDLTATMARDAARQEDGITSLPSNALLERLGGGVSGAPNRVRFAQGALESTRNDLDVALEGEGFLRVQGGDGKARLTRDGRLTLNSNAQLVQASTGIPVLSDGGRAITLRSGLPVTIDPDGSIIQGGTAVARLGVVTIDDPTQLSKRGSGLYEAPQSATLGPATARVIQRNIERSGTDAVRAMLDIGQAERAAGSGSRMIQMHDEIMGRVINTFARLA